MTESNFYPKINNIVSFLFCGFVITWYLQLGSRISILGAIRFELLYGVFLFMLSLVYVPKINVNWPIYRIVLLYYIILIVQTCVSQDIDMSIFVFTERIIKFSVLSYLIIAYVRSPKDLQFFLTAFLLACFKMGQEGFLGRITGNMLWENQGVMRLHGVTSLYEHPNSFSGMSLGTIPFIYKLLPLVNNKIKVLLLALTFLSLNVIIYSGSRTGYVGFIFILIYILIKDNSKKRFLYGFIITGILFSSIVPTDYSDRFESIFTQEDKQGHSTEARKQILKDGLAIFLSNPLGVGVAAFPKVRFKTFGRSQDTHNLYLEIATNLGFQGLLVFGLLVLTIRNTINTVIASASSIKRDLLGDDSLNYIDIHDRDIILRDMKFVTSIAEAIWLFVLLRLILGFFGMDLYEIYWWFAIGLSIALLNIVSVCRKKLEVARENYERSCVSIY